jgi:uncharacterized membrane-anchored protein YhcB (DUF1043 family)
MPYTVTIIRRDRTDCAPTTLTLPRGLFWLLVISLVGLPIGLFYAVVAVLAPKYANDQVAEMKAAVEELEELQMEHTDVMSVHKQLKEAYDKIQQEQAEATARLTIAESARHEALQRMQTVSDENERLQKNLEFYKAFLKPVAEREDIQCYNIKLKNVKGGLSYGVSFMRTDPNKKTKQNRFAGYTKIRLLSGGQVLQLASTSGTEADATHKLGFVKDYRVSGTLRVEIPPTGLRMFDVKAYDNNGSVVAQCWKSF